MGLNSTTRVLAGPCFPFALPLPSLATGAFATILFDLRYFVMAFQRLLGRIAASWRPALVLRCLVGGIQRRPEGLHGLMSVLALCNAVMAYVVVLLFQAV